MRVIDHRRVQQKTTKSRSKKPSATFLVVATIVVLAAGALFILRLTPKTKQSPQNHSSDSQTQKFSEETKKGVLKTFSGEQFKQLYDGFAYPNTAAINETTPITGNTEADAKIKQIAIGRGYKQRSAPVSNTFQDVGGGYLLQQKAVKPWVDLKAAAQNDGIGLGLTAAYRSADDQKNIFLRRLNTLRISPAAIAAGQNDQQVSQVLRFTAIPGYSRHHTGYTVDISCENRPASSFEFTVCFEWLSKNNYENAKKYGWIPSYPKGTSPQGPDPEAWEYVWVGTEALSE